MNANPTLFFFFFFKSTPCCVPKGGVSPLLRSKQPWSPAAGGGQHSPGCSSSSPELLMPSPPASTQQPAQGGVGQDTPQDVELHLISLLVSRSETGVKQPERGSAARSRTIHTSPSSQLTKSQADAAAKVSQRVQVWMHPNPWGIAKAFTQPWHGETVRIRACASARHQTSCFVQVQANPAWDVSSARGVVGADQKSNPGRQQWGENVRKY